VSLKVNAKGLALRKESRAARTKRRRVEICGVHYLKVLLIEPILICSSSPSGPEAREVIFMPHDHKYIIADDKAVQVLLDKMLGGGTRQKRREKLLKALDEASRHYENTTQKERQAFFHGLLTGYAVALKLL
jgi:hypothetical protein